MYSEAAKAKMRLEYAKLRKQSGLEAKAFKSSCAWYLSQWGISNPGPVQWLEAASVVVRDAIYYRTASTW